MKKVTILLAILLICIELFSQERLDHQLRLEPVWTRVADVLGEAGSVESVEFSPDGKYIVSGTKFDYSVVMWRTSDGTELWRRYAAQEIERVGWSSDGKYVAACSEDFLVTVYDAETGETVKELKHTQGIDGLTWSNNGLTLVTGEEMIKDKKGGTQGFIRIFDMPSGKEVKKIDFGSTVNEVAFSEDDKQLLAVGHGGVKVYDTKDWSLIKTLNPDHYVKFISGMFSPDGKHVIATGISDQSRGDIYLWKWQDGKLVKRINHTGKKVESISFHPSGDYVAFAGHTPYIHIYRTYDMLNYKNDNIREANRIWAGDHAEHIDFNPDGSFLASAHQNGLIKLWVWMGEDPDFNQKRHDWVKKEQEAYIREK
ncbi:MAG: hypothetical protein AAF363_02975 [Bacteroidota bacterium]